MKRMLLPMFIALGFPAISMAETRFVAAGSSIQSAINQAGNGDMVLVGPGTYNETIDFLGKAITVISTAGPEHTKLDGLGLQKSIVTFQSSEQADSILEGFTIQRGSSGTLSEDIFGLPAIQGGGMLIKNAGPTIKNCVFYDNILQNPDPSFLVSGAGLHIENGTPTILDCRFASNGQSSSGCHGASGGGGIHNYWNSSTIVMNCIFVNNNAYRGGGIASNQDSEIWIINCSFRDNHSYSNGGAIYIGPYSPATVINGLIHHNTSNLVPGISAWGGTTKVINTTITQNTTAAHLGAGIKNWHPTLPVEIENSILWNNDNGSEQSEEVEGLAWIRKSIVRGGWPGGMQVIDSDPLFVDPSLFDFGLQETSPGIDSGDFGPYAALSGPEQDIMGQTRLVGVAIDLGACEFQNETPLPCPADLNGDAQVGFPDLLFLMNSWGPCSGCSADLDGNGLVSFNDYLLLLSNWGPCF